MQKPTRAAAPAAAAAAAAPPAMFPVTAYVQFKAIKVAGLLKKIDEFNAAVPAGMYANLVNSAINASQEFPADAWCGVSTTRSLSLWEPALHVDDGIILLLPTVCSADAQFDAAGLAEVHVQLEAVTTDGVNVDQDVIGPTLNKMLSWPIAQRFPAVDALRLALLRPALRAGLLDEAGGAELLAACFEMAGIATAGQASTCPGPAEMLSLRCLANSFDDKGSMLNNGVPAKIVAGLGGGRIAQLNKGQLLAATTVLLNLAVAIAKQDAAAIMASADVRNQSLALAASILDTPVGKADAGEIAYRALLCVGTLVKCSGTNFTGAASAALGAGVAGLVASIAAQKGSADARAAAAAAAIQKLV